MYVFMTIKPSANVVLTIVFPSLNPLVSHANGLTTEDKSLYAVSTLLTVISF